MKHLSYEQFKNIFGDLGLTNWVRFNWLGWFYVDDAKLNVKDFQENYSLLEYIESSGTQYIDTGVPMELDSSVRITLQPLIDGSGTDKSFFGVYQSAGRLCELSQYGARFRGNIGEVNDPSAPIIDITKKYEFKYNVRWFFNEIGFGPSQQTSTSHKAFVFCRNYQGADKCNSMKLFDLIIKLRETLQRYFVPAKRKSDNVVGMYDLANGVFYTNDGTDDFIAGDVIA